MKWFPFRITRRRSREVRAYYDAAQTNVDNQQHWAAADSLSPDSAANSSVRKTLRDRARYEAKNNSFCRGIVSTLANDTIGTGPRLRMLTADQKEIEQAWRDWCRDTRFAAKLRTMRVAKAVDGEAIARFVNNMRLPLVKLDLRLYEADQLADPNFSIWRMDTPAGVELVDGIEVDRHGNPVRYHFLQSHPGAGYTGISSITNEGVWVRSSSVIHLFVEDRPGQHRGVPEITPALPLFALLRRYSLSTVAAAETAADLAAVLKTDSPGYTVDDIQGVEPGVSFPIRRRTIMSLPFGWSIQQLKAEQPATTYKEFRDAVITEIARCLNMPKNIAAGDSSDYNYASGRLDHQTYFRAIDVERQEFLSHCVEPTFQNWLREFLSIKSGVAQRDIDLAKYPHRWYWDPRPHVDPEKHAKAIEILWNRGLLTDDDFLMEAGIDPEEHYEKLEAEIERRKPLMLPLPGLAMQSIMTDESGQTAPGFGRNSPADRATRGAEEDEDMDDAENEDEDEDEEEDEEDAAAKAKTR